MSKSIYTVTVGNIGTVYSGPSKRQASMDYQEYVTQSKSGYGRAAYESVTLDKDGETIREHTPAIDYPTIAELSAIIHAIKRRGIEDSFGSESGPDEPHVQVTIGCGPHGWGHQTGDNSFSGAAYDFPIWGTGYVTRGCNARELAKEIIQNAKDNEI